MHFRSLLTFLCSCLLLSSPLHAETFEGVDDIIGKVGTYTVKKNDNLLAIARHFDIGIVELLAANPGVTPKSLKAGAKLKITTMHVLPREPREGIVLNLPELRLFYYVDDETVMTFPITIGREGWLTPLGPTTITRKRKDPTWIPTDAIRKENPKLPAIVPAGPDNPLGKYALNLGWPGYAIHGTNRPSSIGKRASHGCIRLYPEDIETLFNEVDVDTPVTVIDEPYKLGWQGDTLFLEVLPTQLQSDAIAQYRQRAAVNVPEIYQAIQQADSGLDINWGEVRKAIDKRSGIPVAIAKKAIIP